MYIVECAQNIIEASGACLDVKLCSAWPLAPDIWGAQGASPYLAMDTRTLRLIRIKFGIKNRGNEALPGCAHLLDPPFPKGLGDNPESGILFKTLLVRIYVAKCTEINMGAFRECLNVKLCSTWRLAPGKVGLKERLLFWQ